MSDKMDLDKTLARLKAAKGDPDAMALATIDFVLDSYSAGFALALEAASIPHWFDESVLNALLHEKLPDEADWLNLLLKLTIVEEFRTHRAWNIHEVTRLAIRDRLAKKKPERFHELGARAASYFSGETHDQKIERIYHLLTAKPEDGTLELRKLKNRWIGTGEVEQLQALGVGLEELINRDQLEPRAKAYALTAMHSIQSDRVDLKVQMATIREAVDLNSQLGDMIGLVDSYLGLGDVFRKKGNYTKALAAYQQARQSLDKWDQSESKDKGLDELADIHTCVGRTLAERGERERALVEFEAALNVRRELNELDPQDVVSRRNLAVAQVDLGDALINTDRHAEVRSYFTKSLALLEELPVESKGQEITSDIGKLHLRLASYLTILGELDSGEEFLNKAWEIFEQLLSADPDNFSLRSQVVNVQMMFHAFHIFNKEPEQSEKRLEAAGKILSELIEADPTNPKWKGDSATLHQEYGRVRERQNLYKEAVDQYLAAEKLLTDLTESHPDSVSWLLELASVQASMGKLLIWAVKILDRKESETLLLRMFLTLHQSRNTHAALVERDSTNMYWTELLAKREQELASALVIIAEQIDLGVKIESEIEITAEGLRASALDGYSRSVKLYSDLIGNDPTNTMFIKNIAISLSEGASILEAMGNTENALKSYRIAEKFLENFIRQEPKNKEYAARLKSVTDAIARLENK